MKNNTKFIKTALAILVMVGSLSINALAQDAQDAMKKDKTGTNPINFTFDARLYNEYLWLNTEGDGHQNVSTFEFRAPTLGGKLQVRVKARYVDIAADVDDDGSDDISDSGLGDTDVRLLAVPYVDMPNMRAIAEGLEAFFDTAEEDSLGSGTTTLGPQVFAVFFKPFGGFFDIAAPAYQHQISVDEAEGRGNVNRGLIDVFFLKTSGDKRSWALINPTLVLDYENSKEFGLLDIELGTMLDPYLGTKGHSLYLRPGIQIGSDRPVDGSIEAGYKIIW